MWHLPRVPVQRCLRSSPCLPCSPACQRPEWGQAWDGRRHGLTCGVLYSCVYICVCIQPFACLFVYLFVYCGSQGQVRIKRTGAWKGGAVEYIHNCLVRPLLALLSRDTVRHSTKSFDVGLFTAKSFVSFANSLEQRRWIFSLEDNIDQNQYETLDYGY